MYITNHQLLTLIVLFEIGSSTLFSLGIDAKQDAWIVVGISMLVGCVLFWIYTGLQKYFPQKNFIEIIIELLGKFLGMPLAFLYSLFFLYCSTRNLRDFGELMKMTFLHETPMTIIHIIFMFTGCYILFLGLETFARTSELMFPIALSFILSIPILVSTSAKIHISELLPVLDNGIKPVLKAAYPNTVNFPFGEAFVFFMYWCNVNSKKDICKTSILALSISGLLLMISTIFIICTLGVEIASIVTVPILNVIRLINVEDFLTNLDPIAVVIMFLGGFYKSIIFFYAGVSGFTSLFRLKDMRLLIIPCAIFVIWLSIVFAPSYAYHIWQGHTVSLPYIHNTFQVIIPPLLLIICWLKNKGNKTK
jgi:spore germination protein KB